LYDYNYKGYISCFACKVKNGKSYGKCAVNNELAPILEKAKKLLKLFSVHQFIFKGLLAL